MNVKLNTIKEGPGYRIFSGANIIIMVLIMAIIIIPIVKVVIDSVDKNASELAFRLLPKVFTLGAYELILTRPNILRPFLISLLTTALGTMISMTVTSLYAYSLAQRDLPGKSFFLYIALITMVFRAGMIPLYLVVRDLGMLNSLLPILLVKCVDAYYLILLKNFFSTIPKSIIDAAEIDGCSPLKTFVRIVLPLSKPGLAAISLFYIVLYWNQFFDYILYLTGRRDLYNFQVFLRSLVIENDTQGYEGFSFATQSLKNAAIVTSIVPIAILYPFLQKYFVKGINLGAVKG